MTIGGAIKRLREAAGLSRAELGRQIGVTGAAVGQWERLQNGVRVENIRRIAGVLGQPVEAFYAAIDPSVRETVVVFSDEDLIVHAFDHAIKVTGIRMPAAQAVEFKMQALEFLRTYRAKRAAKAPRPT